uniref:Retrovirus-related Pol polyprotein from transposon 17.6 n=1 Tax=Cajanus cajan TaxID=3821 RepID=A0A151U4J1_CAJCA|nr:hypothetical protein KK1_006912 [Cajanus cajan]
MYLLDKVKTTFITQEANFCYHVVPFKLKNVGVTYQWLMDKFFQKQIGRNLEVYVDVVMVKSNNMVEHINGLVEVF